MIGWGIHFQISGLGSRVPGSGVQVRVQVQDLNFPVPEPVPDNPHLRPEGRDLGPGNGWPQTPRETGDRMIGWGNTFSGLGSQQSGTRYRSSGSGTGSGPEFCPYPHLYLINRT